MFDMGFLPGIRRIFKHLPKNRQTLLFSATMPDDIRKLTAECLRNPVTVQMLLPGNLRVPISPASVIVAFVVSCSTGLLFGYLPANQAAKLQPIESLRYE